MEQFDTTGGYEETIRESDSGGYEVDAEKLRVVENREREIEKLNITVEEAASLEQELDRKDLPESLRKLYERLLKNKGVERTTLH